MKFASLLILFLLLTTSCSFLEKEKITSETILEEELKSINWNEVDVYPVFPNCNETAQKQEQINCFTTTLTTHIETYLKSKELLSKDKVSVAIPLNLLVDENGQISIKNTIDEENIRSSLPEINQWLAEAVAELPKIDPALKRGIPVKTQFVLPLMIQTE
jgi:hypothetical protein